MAGFRVVLAVAVVSLCALFYACGVAHLQVPVHYANFQLEVDPRPVPVPAGAEEVEGKGPKGEKGGRAASDASGDPSLQSKGRTEQQARGSRRPRPTTTPREAAQAAQAAGDGGGAREKAEILRLEAENKLLREQLKAAEAARKTAQDALTGERALWERREKGWEKQRGELQQQVTATAQVRAVGGGGGQRVVPTPTMCSMCCTCRRRRWSCTLHSAPNGMWPSTWGSKRPPSRS